MYTGKVVRPDFDTGDKPVKLTATVTKGLITKTISFDAIVKKLGITDGQSVVKDLAWLTVPSSTKINLELPTEGPNNTKISWSSKTPGTISNTGLVVRPDVGVADATVTITATVQKGTESQQKEFQVLVYAWTTEDELEDAKNLIKWELIAGTNMSINMVTTDLVFPIKLGREVTVAWTTNNKDFCEANGTVTRPTYTQGPVIISVGATLTKAGKTAITSISGIRLEPAAITNGEIALDAINKLNETAFLGNNTSLSQITETMILPTSITGLISDACSFGWSLVDVDDAPLTTPYVTLQPKTQHVECKISKPKQSEGNYICYLKATATANDVTAGSTGTANKRFRLVVLAEVSP